MLEKEYLDTLCNTGDGVFVVNADRHIVRWNKAAERILKYSEDEVMNRECFCVISGRESPDKAFCGRNCKIHNGVSRGALQKNFDLLTQTGHGEPLWLNVTILTASDSSGPAIAHIVRDVTREKSASLALERFLADLEPLSPKSDKASDGNPTLRNLAVTRHEVLEKPTAALSAREIEVLTLLAEGLTTRSLAQKLNISHFTARNHIQNILVKLDLHSKAQAVSYAFKRGILSPSRSDNS
jgi:PAS domain S-box-containing protein